MRLRRQVVGALAATTKMLLAAGASATTHDVEVGDLLPLSNLVWNWILFSQELGEDEALRVLSLLLDAMKTAPNFASLVAGELNRLTNKSIAPGDYTTLEDALLRALGPLRKDVEDELVHYTWAVLFR